MSPLSLARAGIGLGAAVTALEYWPLLDRLTGDPRMVAMPLAPWPRPSSAVAHGLLLAWAGLGVAVAADVAVPVCGALLAALAGYLVTLDQQLYSNHLYLLALVSLLIALAHTPRHREAALTVLRWQLVIVYGFAALSKINPEFLSGAVLAGNLRPSLRGLAAGPLASGLAVAAIGVEGFVAATLMRPRWRAAGAVAGVVLHLGFILAITQTVAMIAFTVICLSLYPLYWRDRDPGAAGSS